jgi:hypothetical protein
MKAIRYIKVIFQSNFAHSVLSTVIFAGDQHNQLRKTQKSGRIFFLIGRTFWLDWPRTYARTLQQ